MIRGACGIRLVGISAETGRELLLTVAFVLAILLFRAAIVAAARLTTGRRRNERVLFWTRSAGRSRSIVRQRRFGRPSGPQRRPADVRMTKCREFCDASAVSTATHAAAPRDRDATGSPTRPGRPGCG